MQAGLGGLTVEKSLAEELVAAHLGLAMILIGLLLWIALRARVELAAAAGTDGSEPAESRSLTPARRPVRGLKPLAAVAAGLLLCAIVAGGYVAGTEEEGLRGQGVERRRRPHAPAARPSRPASTTASFPSARAGSPTSTSPTASSCTPRHSRSCCF